MIIGERQIPIYQYPTSNNQHSEGISQIPTKKQTHNLHRRPIFCTGSGFFVFKISDFSHIYRYNFKLDKYYIGLYNIHIVL